jgi:hypothetical protein
VHGFTPAIEVGAAAVFLGMLTALAIPAARRVRAGRSVRGVRGALGARVTRQGSGEELPLEERYLDRWPVASLSERVGA